MGVWTTSILIVIIYQNHILTAPLSHPKSAITSDLKTKFGKIADQIVNPEWTLTNPDSKKKENDPDPSQNTTNENGENQPNENNNDNKSNNRPSFKKSSNKKKSNKRKQNNIKSNGKQRWYKLVTVDYLLGKLPEYRNNENEQNVVLVWRDGDERKIELNEHVDILSVKNLYNNQLIRKKRNYNDTFPLQNKLQTKNVKQEDSKENEKNKLNMKANTNNHNQDIERQNKKLENKQNVRKKKTYENIEKSRGPNSFEKELSLIDNSEDDENSMNSKSIDNTNENMKFLKFKNSSRHKFQYVVNNKKHPINIFQNNQKYRNKLNDPTHAQKKGKKSRKNVIETDRPRLNTVKEKKISLNDIPTISRYKPEFNTKRTTNIPTDITELNKIDTFINDINSNTDENIDNQNIEIYPLSNLNKIEHKGKSKSKKKGQQHPNQKQNTQNRNKQKLGKPLGINNNNKQGSHPKTIKPNSPNKKDILIISYDEPKNTTKINSNIADSMNEPDEIDTLLDNQNRISDEELQDQTNESYPFEFETKEDVQNYSDVQDIKEHDISKNIKRQLKNKSRRLEKKQSDDNKKLPNKIKPKLNPSLKSNNENGTGSSQKPIKNVAPNIQEIPKKSNDIPKLTTEENNDKVGKTPEPDGIDTLLDNQNWNSDEELQDQTNESYPFEFETKEDVQNYSDVQDIKEHDISKNIKRQLKNKSRRLEKKQSDDNKKLPNKIKPKLNPSLKSNNENGTGSSQKPIKNVAPNIQEIPKKSNDIPKLTTEENNDKVGKTPEPDGIDTLLDNQNWNSDEELQDQTNESYPFEFETKEDVQNYSDVQDIKEHDISKNIKRQLKNKSKSLEKKQSDDNKKLPNKIKTKLNPSLKSNNENGTGSPQKPIKNVAPNIQEIPKKSNDIPKLTTEENNDKVGKTPEPDGIDTLLDNQNWNSDEELQDQTNESYPFEFETKEDVQNYSDVQDIKEHDISKNIKRQLKNKSKSLKKKQSDDNKKFPNKIKPKLNPSLKSNNENGTGSPQKPIKNVAPNIQEIPKKSNDIPKLTTEENNDKVGKTPEPDGIDTLLDNQNWNSDEELQDQTNESYPFEFETKEDVQNYSDVQDIKEHDISKNIKRQLKNKSRRLEKKQSDDNKKLPNKIKPKLNPSPKSNNENGTGSSQKPIKNVAPNIQEILKKSNDIPKLTTEENNDKVGKTPEPDGIDTLLDNQNWNSDEELQDQTNESYPFEFETKEDVQNYSDVQDIKEHDISKNIKRQLKNKSKSLEKKQSDDNKKFPNKIKPKLNPSLKSNNENGTGSPQKPIKNVAPNIQEIPKKSNDILKLTTEENNDKVGKTPEPDEIDTILDNQNWNSDEELQDQTNESYPFDFETKEDVQNYSDVQDIKEHDISKNIKRQLKNKSKRLGKKISDDHKKLPNKIKPKLNPSLKSNYENGTGSPQKPNKNVAPNIQEIPKKSNDIPKLTTEENNDKVGKTPEPDGIDTLLDNQNWNSDEELQDQTNESYPFEFETKEDVQNYSDVQDIKEHDISKNIKRQLKNKSKTLEKKQSDDNKKFPNKIKPKLNPSLKSNYENGTGSPQKPIKNVAPNIQEIPKKSNDIPKLTTEENKDKIGKTPEPDEIDTILDNQNWNSDEELQDQTNESYPFDFETKEDVQNYSDVQDIKEHDISKNIKRQLKNKSKSLEKKQSDDNKKFPNKIKPKLNPSLKSNNENGTGSPQKPIKNVAPNIQEIPKKSNDILKLTTEENNDKVGKTPEPDEIDTILDNQNWNSDEELQDQTNESYPFDFETKEDVQNYSDVQDIKEHDISKNIKRQLKNKSKRLGKKISDDHKKLPNKIKPKLNPSLKSNYENGTGSPQKPIKNVAPNIQEIPKKSNDIPKLTTEENNDKVGKTPEPDGIDTLLDNQNWNSDEELQDQTNESYPFEFETKEDVQNYSDVQDIKEHDISKNIKRQLKNKSKTLEKKQSDDNKKFPNKIKPKLNPSLKSNYENGTGSPQKPIKNVAPNIQEIPKKSNDIPKLTTEENKDKIGKTPEPDKIDTQLDAQNWNSDEEREKNKSMENTNIIIEKPHIKEESNSNKYVTPNMYSQNLSMDNSDGDIEILDMLDDYDNLDGVTIDYYDLKKTNDKSPNIKEQQDNISMNNNKSINNIDDNKTIKPEIPDSNGKLNLPDEILEELMAFTDDSLPNSKDDNIESLIPKGDNSQNIVEKNGSIKNTNIIIEKPHIKEESYSNKYVTPNMYSQNLSMDNSDGDIEILDMFDDYDNLDGVTMDDSDLKKTNDKSPNIKDKQDNNSMNNNNSTNNIDDNKTIKPEIADNIGTLNLYDEILEDLMAFNNDLSYEKRDKEKPSDKSISVEPKADNISKSNKELSTADTLDKNSNIDTDKTIQKETQPNPFESETGKPISSDDIVNTKSTEIPIISIPKSDKPISNSSLGNQEITDVVDKMISSPVFPAFISHIDQEGLKLPSVDSDDITVNAIEETDDSLPNSKDDNIESLIPKGDYSENILEKNMSMENTNITIEKPHIMEESISNKYVTPNIYSQNLSMDNSDGDIEILDMLDDYDNLDGMTLDDSDLKKTNDKSPNIKDKQDTISMNNNKSINNIDDNKTIKPEIPDSNGKLNLPDEILEELMAFTDDSLPNSKDDNIESLIPKGDNSQNIVEQNGSKENTNIIIEKPHIKEESNSNKYVTPNMYSQNLSMDNSDGDIEILDMFDDYDNLDGVTMDDSDLKKTIDKSPNIKDKQDNNSMNNNNSTNNIDDNKTIKPEIADNIGTLNLYDEILEDLMAFNNDLSYEKRDKEKPSDKSISVEPKADNISKSNKELSTADTLDIGTLNLYDDILEDLMAFNNDLSYEKRDKEKPSDKSISVEPKADNISKSNKELSTADTLDKNSNIDTDKTIQKETQPNPFESETGKPISSDDIVNTKSTEIPIISIPKSDKPISNSSLGNQEITDVVDKMISSPVFPAFISHIDQEGLKLPSVDSGDITVNAIEETDDSLPNSKDDNIESLIPKGDNSENILEKNMSMENTNIIIEKPHIMEESISNKYVTPNMYSQNLSMDNSDGDIEILDMLDDYDNLDGMTLDDSDLKKTNDKSPNIKDKQDTISMNNNKSINNIDDNKTIKPEIPDSNGKLNLPDEILEELMAFTDDSLPNSKDDNIESLIPKGDNSQNIVEKNGSIENTNIIIEKPHIKEESNSNKYVTPNMYSQNLSMDNSDGDIEILDMFDDYDNLDGVTMDDSDLKKTIDKSPNIKDKQDNNSMNNNNSTNNIDDNKTIKPEIADNIGTLNLYDEILEDLMAFNNDLSYEKRDKEKPSDKSISVEPKADNISKSNKELSTADTLDIGTLNLYDDILEDLMAFNNDLSYEKRDKEKPSDKSISVEPKADNISKSNKELSTADTLDKNSNIDTDKTIQKETQPNPFESETGKPISSDDIVNTKSTEIPIISIPKSDKPISNSSLGNQEITDVVDKMISSPVFPAFISHIDQEGLKLPSVDSDDITVNAIEETDDSLPNSKDDNIESLIPKGDYSENILEKNMSMENTNITIEKPHIMEESISNKYVTPNIYSQNLSMDNSDGDIEILDMLDDYDNLDGMTLDDSDLKKTNDKSPNIKDKQDTISMNNNKSINNIDDNKTIKPEIPDSNGKLNLPDEILEELMAFTDDSLPNSKDDNIESLIPKGDNSQNIVEQNGSKENTNIIIEKPHIKEESNSNKYVTPNMYSQNLSMDNSDGDIEILDMFDDYDNLDGVTMDDSDLKKTIDKSPNIKDKQDNNSMNNNNSTNNIDDNKTIKPEIADNIGTLNLYDEILEDLMAFNNDLSYEKRDKEKPSDKSISVEPKADNISKSNKELSTADTLDIGTLNLYDDILEDLMAFNNDLSYEKRDKEKPSDKSISVEPKADNISKSNKELSTADTLDKNSNIDTDKTIQKETQPNPFESETGKPISSDDIVNTKSTEIPIISIPKSDKPISNSSLGNQEITDVVDKMISSPVFPAFISHIDQEGLKLPSVDSDDITVNAIEETDDSLPNSKDDNIESLIPKGDNSENILEKNMSMENTNIIIEKPHIMEESISNKYVTPNMYSQNLSMDNSDGDIEILDMLDDYDNLDGMTLDDSDLKKTNDKSPNIKDKQDTISMNNNKSINNIDDNKTIKPEIPDSNGKLNLPDEILEELMAFTDDSLPNSKDDNIESLIPKGDNSQNIVEQNGSKENTNIIIEKPHIKEESNSNKYVTPNMYSQNLSMDNSDGDIEILDMFDDYDNLDGVTMDDSDLKKTIDKSPNIKDKQDNNSMNNNNSTNNIDDNKTIKPEIADNIGTLNLYDEILEDLMAFNNDLSYEKRDKEKPSDKSISVEPKADNISKSNKELSTADTLDIGTLNLYDDILEDLMAFNNDLSYEKRDKEKPSDKSISVEPKADNISKSNKELSTADTLDKNSNIDTDKTIQKETQPNPFESETGKPISSDDIVNTKSTEIPIISIPKSDKPISNSSLGNQEITDVVDKMISSPVFPAFITHIDQEGLKLPSVDSDDITVNAIEETDDSLPNSKDDNIESLIPKGDYSENILEKNMSMENTNITIEKPHIMEESISNKYVTPNIYSQNLSMDNSDGDIEILDMLDDYDNLDGMTLDDSDLKKTNDKSPNIKDKQDTISMNNNKSINNIDDNKTIKPEIPDSNGKLNLPDEILEELMAFTDDSLPNSKDDNIESLIPKGDNSQNIVEQNGSKENTNIIIEKPHIKEESNSNKYVTPNMYSQNLSMDNSDGDIEILDMFDDYDNLDGVTMDDSDLKKTIDKSPNIKDKQDNNSMNNNNSTNNIDDNKTIKPEIADNIGTLNLYDEILEDLMAFNNDLSYEKRDKEKPSDKSISVEPKADNISKSNKELSTADTLDIGTLNLYDDILEDLMAFNNDLSYEKRDKEKPSDKSISVEPKADNISKSNKELSTADTLDKNSNIDTDKTIQKETQPNPFESETGKPISSYDIVNTKSTEIPIISIPKSDKPISNSSLGNQEITDVVDKMISSPVFPAFISHIDQEGLKLPSVDSDDITVNAIEETDDSLPNSKNDNIESLIPKGDNSENILEKNMSMENTNIIIEKPHIMEESISNKYVTPNMYSQNLSMDNSDGDIEILDMFDDYDNLDGVTMDDSDLKKTIDKSPNIKDKQDNNSMNNNNSTNNIDDNKTIKPEIADNIGTLNLSDEILEDLLSFNNDLSYEKRDEEKPTDKSISVETKADNILKSDKELSTYDTVDKNCNMKVDGIPLKFTSVKGIKQKNKEFLRTTPSMEKHTKTETPKEFVQTKINNDTFLLANDKPKVNLYNVLDNKYYDSNHIDKLTKIINDNSHNYHYSSSTATSEDNSPIISDYNLMNENDNSYGYKLPKFITKYIEDGNSNNLKETVPPRKNNNFSIHKDSDNYNNDINQSIDYIKHNTFSYHVNNNKNNISETETVKNIYDDKGNYTDITDIHNKMYDDFFKKISEQLFGKIDKMYEKISKLGNLSNNSTYITQNFNMRPDDPVTKKNVFMNDLPISKPINNIDEPDSKINKSVETHETMINYKINDENVIKESIKPKKDKHKKHKRRNKKYKKHLKHNKHKKKKSHKKNDKNYDYDDDDDDDDEDDDNDEADRSHNKYKIHKNNNKNDDKHKNKKSRKKNEVIDNDIDDNDNNGRIKKKSHKKNYIDDDEIEISRSKKTDKKKKKKIKKSISLHESNEVNNSSSLQLNSEDDDSVKGLKIKRKSKKPTKTNSTKKKKSLPKKKPKYIKHSKSMKYKSKEIPVDVSDEDLSSNKNNYNFEEIYVKSSRNNNQNNAPKEKTHKHKKPKKPLKISKTYKYKEIPVDNKDKISDENSVNLEETYNINITNDGNALKQKRLKHKRLKKMKNIDINIVKDTDNQVLDRNTNTRHGFQFYTIYPQYRYANPFARLFYNR